MGGIYVAANEAAYKANAAIGLSTKMTDTNKSTQDPTTEEILMNDCTKPWTRNSKKGNEIDLENVSAFVPGTLEYFWECKHCSSLPIPWRASGSVVFCANSLTLNHVGKHLQNCQGAKALRIPRDAVLSVNQVDSDQKIHVRWNSRKLGVSRRSFKTHRRFNAADIDISESASVPKPEIINVDTGVEEKSLALPEDRPMTTDFAWFTVSQLKKCYLTKAGGSRGNCPIGYPGLACKFCTGTSNERRFFYTSADHLRNSFSHIPSHLLSCSETPESVKEKVEEYKTIRNKQKSQLKAGDHKEFIDNIWFRLHGPGGGTIDQKSENEDIVKVEFFRDEDKLEDVAIEFQSDGDDFHSMSIDGRVLDSKDIAKETSHSLFLNYCDRKLTSDYVFFSLLQMIPKQFCIDKEGQVLQFHSKDTAIEMVEQSESIEPVVSSISDEYENMKEMIADRNVNMPADFDDENTEEKILDLDDETNEMTEHYRDTPENVDVFVTLICKHCNDESDVICPSYCPKSAEDVRLTFSEIPKHLMSCRHCPNKVKTTLKCLSASRAVQEALLKKGSQKKFMKTVWGRVEDYYHNNDQSVNVEVKEDRDLPQESASNILSAELLHDSDRVLVTDYTFFTMQQMDPVILESSGNGSRSMFQNGFPGLACRHCAGKPHARKFFYRTSEILSGNYAHIPNHVLTCKYTPFEVKRTLSEMKKDHQLQKSRLSRGSQRIFFNHIWNRLHNRKRESGK